MSAGIEWVDDDWGYDDRARDGRTVAGTVPAAVPVEVLLAGRTGGQCCVRLNCTERGLPTRATRCPRCDHPTQSLGDYRFPRTVFG